MPLTVITLTNISNALRGDLSKWMQEIATGVYVGNFNVKVRENLWKRIKDNIGNGQATLTYYTRNEIGYNFDTINYSREVIDLEGIPLILFPSKERKKELKEIKNFSNASKFRKIDKYSSKTKKNTQPLENYVIIDIETDGLDENINSIIEIAALKVVNNEISTYNSLITIDKKIPKIITDLTKIDDLMLKTQGKELNLVLNEFLDFIEDYTLVGYNIDFDIKFINKSLKNLDRKIQNESVDLYKIVQKKLKLSNYKLMTVSKYLKVSNFIPHRAYLDVKIINEVFKKLNEF